MDTHHTNGAYTEREEYSETTDRTGILDSESYGAEQKPEISKENIAECLYPPFRFLKVNLG
jgi:hypothetical protein